MPADHVRHAPRSDAARAVDLTLAAAAGGASLGAFAGLPGAIAGAALGGLLGVKVGLGLRKRRDPRPRPD